MASFSARPAWADVVLPADQDVPPAEREQLARRAFARIQELGARLARAGENPNRAGTYRVAANDRTADDEALALAALLAEHDPLKRADLADAGRLFAWVERRPANWEWMGTEGDDDEPDFGTFVLDGRPDLGHLVRDDDEIDPDDPEAASDAERNAALDGEEPLAWRMIAHGHDDHRMWFWDPTRTDAVRVLLVDNSLEEVIERDHRTGAAFLTEQVLRVAYQILYVDLQRELGGGNLEELDQHRPDRPPLAVIAYVALASAVLAAIVFAAGRCAG